MSRRVPVRAVVRSEWTKLRSLRSAWLCLVLYAGAVVVGAWTTLSGTTAPADPAVAVQRALVGFAPAQLVLLVLGALVVTTEYRTGTVVASLVAVPRRTRWLLVKTVVVAFWVAAVSAALAAGCIAAIPTVTAGTADLPFTDAVVLRPIAVQVAAAVCVLVLGVGLGALARRVTPAAVAGGVLVALLPTATAVAGDVRIAATAPYWPSLPVGEDDVLAVATHGSLGLPAGGEVLLAGATAWPTGLAVNAAWALAAWLLGALATERRDV